MVKKMPDWTMNWKKKATRPPVICTLRNMEGRKSGSPPRCSSRPSHSSRPPTTRRPPTISHTTGETPRITGAPGLGFTNPHTPGAEYPEHGQGESHDGEDARRTGRTCTRASGGVSWILRSPTRITATITTSPANTHRHEAKVVTATADQRPGGHGDGPGRGDEAVGVGAALTGEVAGHQGHDGRHDQGGAEAFEHRTSR